MGFDVADGKIAASVPGEAVATPNDPKISDGVGLAGRVPPGETQENQAESTIAPDEEARGMTARSSSLHRMFRRCRELEYPPDAKEIPPLSSDKTHGNINASNITLKVNDQMPVAAMRRGYVNRAFEGESAAKIVRVPAMVFGEFVVLDKADVGLLIERDFDDVFGS